MNHMTTKAQTHHVKSIEELRVLAGEIAAELGSGDVLLLSGDLGSGKTTFTQVLAQALGVKDPVTSPTFTIVAEYEVVGSTTLDWLVHIDLYRVPSDQHGIDRPYIAEVIDTAADHKRVIVVEWPEKLDLTVPHAWQLSFAMGKADTERVITITKP